MLDQLKKLLTKPPRISTHPVLGELHYHSCQPRTWQGKFIRGDKDVSVTVDGTKQQPDERLISLAAMVVGRLDEFEQLALSFQSTLPHSFATDQLKLIELSVIYPVEGRSQGARSGPMKSVEPIFALVFSITNDRNVLDIIFEHETPVDADYH